MNERCPADGKFMAREDGDNWRCASCGKGWRIIYSKAGSRIAAEFAPSPQVVDTITNRELLERIATKIGVSIEN